MCRVARTGVGRVFERCLSGRSFKGKRNTHGHHHKSSRSKWPDWTSRHMRLREDHCVCRRGLQINAGKKQRSQNMQSSDALRACTFCTSRGAMCAGSAQVTLVELRRSYCTGCNPNRRTKPPTPNQQKHKPTRGRKQPVAQLMWPCKP